MLREKKDLILQVGIGNKKKAEVARDLGFHVAILRDARYHKKASFYHWADSVVSADLLDRRDVRRQLLCWKDRHRVVGVVNFYDQYVKQHARVARTLHVSGPDPRAVAHAVDKFASRKILGKNHKALIPDFAVVRSEKLAIKVAQRIGFPVVVKPAQLDQAKFVTINHHEKELKKNVHHAFRGVRIAYAEKRVSGKPTLLVEEYLTGKQFSVDVFIDPHGQCVMTPPVEYILASDLGKPHVYSAAQFLPSSLSAPEIRDAHVTVKKAVRALGLQSCVAHIELMNTPRGWKMIEVNPRLGGLRGWLFEQAYGVDLDQANVLQAVGRFPRFQWKTQGASAMLKFYPEKEGRLRARKGLSVVRRYASFRDVRYNGITIGDRAGRAEAGFLSPCQVLLTHRSREVLQNDMANALQTIAIQV